MAATPTATTAMAAASASVSTPPASTAASALCLGTCFIHHEVSPAEILTVQGVHRAIRVFVIGHFNEGKPARLSRKPIANQIDARGSYTDLRKPLVELLFRRGKRKITEIELSFTGSPASRATSGARPLLQRSVASSRKLTAFATEIVPQRRAPFSRATLPPLSPLRRISGRMRPLCSPPERSYARHDDEFSADAAHYPGALREDFFARRDCLPQTRQVHCAYLLRRILPARTPPRGGPDQTRFAAW